MIKVNTLDHIRIVLAGTTHPGNIGAAARAMKTMGLSRLALVAPKIYPSAEATARAAGADDILAQTKVFATLQEAVADCVMVYGTSARLRTLQTPVCPPEMAARQLLEMSAGQQVAVVFGRERTGLTNEELDLCHRMIVIPSNPDFSSLNLAAAVQILCYELCKLAQDSNEAESGATNDSRTAVSMEQLDHFYQHLEQMLVDIDFLDPEKPRRLMRRLRQLFNRAELDQNEYNILRGILTAVQESVRDK